MRYLHPALLGPAESFRLAVRLAAVTGTPRWLVPLHALEQVRLALHRHLEPSPPCNPTPFANSRGTGETPLAARNVLQPHLMDANTRYLRLSKVTVAWNARGRHANGLLPFAQHHSAKVSRFGTPAFGKLESLLDDIQHNGEGHWTY